MAVDPLAPTPRPGLGPPPSDELFDIDVEQLRELVATRLFGGRSIEDDAAEGPEAASDPPRDPRRER